MQVGVGALQKKVQVEEGALQIRRRIAKGRNWVSFAHGEDDGDGLFAHALLNAVSALLELRNAMCPPPPIRVRKSTTV